MLRRDNPRKNQQQKNSNFEDLPLKAKRKEQKMKYRNQWLDEAEEEDFDLENDFFVEEDEFQFDDELDTHFEEIDFDDDYDNIDNKDDYEEDIED